MNDILFSTTIVAAFIGGAVALFAPCCISVMLPAYFATSFERRRALVSMTFVFAFGVSAVILPIALGASGLTRLFVDQHTLIFLVGGALMVTMGAAMALGWKPRLPMPGGSARQGRGPTSVFALGAFSGVASACCAPVLAGVVALSGAVGSFVSALTVGVAYVFGMVVPLFVMALLWDRYDWGRSPLLRGRALTLRAFGRSRTVHSTSLVSGVLLVGMGLIIWVLAFTGTAMPRRGWQVDLAARLQHYGKVVLSWVDGVPGWLSALAIFAALGAIAWKAIGQSAATTPDQEDPETEGDVPAPPRNGQAPGCEAPTPGNDIKVPAHVAPAGVGTPDQGGTR